MHELQDNSLHLMQEAEKVRCISCRRTLLLINGADVMVRQFKEDRSAPVVLLSAGTLIVKCCNCGTVQYQDGKVMRPYLN